MSTKQSLDNFLGKSYISSSKDSLFRKLTFSNNMANNSLDFVASTNEQEFRGFVYDKRTRGLVAPSAHDYGVQLSSIKLYGKSINLFAQRKELPRGEQKKHFSSSTVSDWLVYTIEGGYVKGIPRIDYLSVETPVEETLIDIRDVKKTLGVIANNILYDRSVKRNFSVSTVARSDAKERPHYSSIVGIYNGILEEQEIQNGVEVRSTRRKHGAHPRHIRRGHTKTYRNVKEGVVRELAMPPMVVHAQLYEASSLMELGFESDGTPTIDGIYMHRGSLSDEHIKTLIKDHNFKTLDEVKSSLKTFAN